ncbi:MAG: hypothetical protein ABFD15_08165 [Methanofastidiosum sp.]
MRQSILNQFGKKYLHQKSRLSTQLKKRVIRFYDPDKFIIEVAESMSEVIQGLHQLGMSKKDISIKTQMPLKAVNEIIS